VANICLRVMWARNGSEWVRFVIVEISRASACRHKDIASAYHVVALHDSQVCSVMWREMERGAWKIFPISVAQMIIAESRVHCLPKKSFPALICRASTGSSMQPRQPDQLWIWVWQDMGEA